MQGDDRCPHSDVLTAATSGDCAFALGEIYHLSAQITAHPRLNLTGHAIRRSEKYLVQLMHVSGGYGSRSMADQRAHGKLRQPEISRGAGERMAKCVRRHPLEFRLQRNDASESV